MSLDCRVVVALSVFLVSVADLQAADIRPSRTLSGHSGFVEAVVFSPDGKLVASGGKDGSVVVWDVATGREKWTLDGHTERVTSLAFSPDGKLLASGSFDKTVRLWDPATGKKEAVLRGHTHWVNAIAFSPDGKLLATGGSDKVVILWERETFRESVQLDAGFFAVSAVSFSGDGKLLAVGSHSGTVTMWNMETRKAGAVLKTDLAVLAAAISSDGKTVAVSGGSLFALDKPGKLALWDVADKKERVVLSGHTAVCWRLAFSRDGKRLITAAFDRTAKVWDVADGKELFTLAGHTEPVMAAAFSSDGKSAVTGGYDKTVRLWELGDGPRVGAQLIRHTLRGHTGEVSNIAVTADGRSIVAVGADKIGRVWDIASGRETAQLQGHERGMFGVAISPDGKSIATASQDKTVILWDLTTGKKQLALPAQKEVVTAVAFSPDGKTLATATGFVRGGAGEINLWNAATGRRASVLTGNRRSVFALHWSKEGFFSGGGEPGYPPELIEWDIETAKPKTTFTGLTGGMVSSMALSADGKSLVVASYDRSFARLDRSTGKVATTYKGHATEVQGVAMSADGRWIASASDDRSVRIWDAATGTERVVLNGHTKAATAVAFIPGSRLLASSSVDGTVIIWDLAVALGSDTPLPAEDLPFARFTVKKGGFRVLMPGTPEEKTRTVQSLDGPLTLNFFIVRDQRATYGVTYTRFPDASLRAKTPARHLEDAVEGAATLTVRKITDKPIKLGDHSGRELLLATTDEQVYTRMRLYFFRGTLYQLSISGPGRSMVTGDAADRFLDSFQELPLELTEAQRASREKELEALLMSGDAAKKDKNFALAVKEFEKARVVARELGQPFETLRGAITGQLAELYVLHLGRSDEAEPLYLESIRELDGATDPDEKLVATMMMCRLAQLYQQRKEHDRAEVLYLRALHVAPENKDVLLVARSGLGQVYFTLKSYDKAGKMFRDAIAAGRGSEDPAGLIDLSKYYLASIQRKTGEGSEAIEKFGAIIAAAESGISREPTAAYLSVVELLHIHTELGQIDKAREVIDRVPALAKRVTPTSSKALAALFTVVFTFHASRGDLIRADQAANECVSRLEATFGPKHPLLSTVFAQIGVVKMMRGDMAAGEASMRRALAILDDPTRPNDRDKLSPLHALAAIQCNRGDFASAEKTCRQALDILDALRAPPDDPLRVMVQSTVAIILSNTGRSGEARKLLDDLVAVLDKVSIEDHPNLAAVLPIIARLYQYQGELPKAEAVLRRVRQAIEKQLGPDHPFLGAHLALLAQLNLEMKRTEEGLRVAREAAKVLEASQGKDSIIPAFNRHTMARLHMLRGEWAEARGELERSRAIYRARLDPNHPQLARVLADLADVSWAEGNVDAASQYFDESRRIDFHHIHQNLPFLAESDQIAFLRDSDTPNLYSALSLARALPGNARLIERSAAWVLNAKGTALRVLAERQLLARQSTDPKAGNLIRDWLQVRQELAGLKASVPEPGKERERGEKLAALISAEAGLSRRIGQVVGHKETHWVELDEVRRAIPKDGVLIEIVRMYALPPPGKGGTPRPEEARYLALIIPPAGTEEVRMIDLGPAREIEMVIREFREQMAEEVMGDIKLGERSAEKKIRSSLAKISHLVLEPLLPHIEKKDRWLICPDGETWLIPYAALPIVDNKYAVEKYRIRYMVSGRDLLWTAPAMKTNPPLVMAAPDYYLDFDEARKQTRRLLSRPPPPPAPRRTNVRTFDGISRRWSSLEGTEREVEVILPYIRTYAGAEPSVYRGKEALEGVFLSVERPSVIVLSTHGFIIEPAGFSRKNASPPALTSTDPLDLVGNLTVDGQPAGSFSFRDLILLHEHPALCCGLVLAGANSRGQGDPTGEDGILTGWEILGVDLRGTKLVVLSACQTALGRVQESPQSGACVAGLRQAFQVAGAKQVVATLWEIPDDETAPLMEEYFKRLAAGVPEDEALRDAQVARIEARRAKKKGAAHPLFWAAFTITGQGP
jgi:WD40 repeat protein/CHAT domain-containing protein/tetratricopeptide (TPR) repeat protein